MLNPKIEDSNVITATATTDEPRGIFKRASDGLVEFAHNRPVAAAVVTMAAYDIGKAAVRGPVTKGARYVSGKVGSLIGRRAAQATVGATNEQVAHLIGGLVKSIF